jgi:L-fucose isomerase-like protein
MENDKNHKIDKSFVIEYPSQSVLQRKKKHSNLTHKKFIRKRKIIENYFENHGILISGVFDAPISRYTAASLTVI